MNSLSQIVVFILTSASTFMGDQSYELLENIYYTDQKIERQMGEVLIPSAPGPHPGVILVHGGGWNSREFSDMHFIAKSLASHGFVVFNINYRLAPEHLHPAPIEDLTKAISFFKSNAENYKLNPQKIALWGYSAGGHIVSYFALKNSDHEKLKVQAVVTGGTPFDFTWYPLSPIINRYMGGFRDEKFQEYIAASVTSYISSSAPPFFLYHGVEDRLVEFVQTSSFEAKLKQNRTPVTRHDVYFWGHINTFLFSKQSVQKGIEFLKKTIR